MKVADTHLQNARNLVHDWRAKSGNSENYCPPVPQEYSSPPAGPLVPVRCFPPAGAGFPTGEFEPSPSHIRGNGENLRPPETSMVAVVHTSFVHPPAPHTAFLSKRVQGWHTGPVGSPWARDLSGKDCHPPANRVGKKFRECWPPSSFAPAADNSRNHFSACHSSSGGLLGLLAKAARKSFRR